MSNTLSVLDYVLFSIILAVPALIGFFFAWKARTSQSTQNYLMGNRQLSVFPVAMSLLASFLSAVGMLGVPAITYYQGMQFAWSLPSAALAIAITCVIFLPVFYDMKLNSINEYLHERFQSKAMRLVGSISFIASTIPYLGMALYAPSLALGSVTGLSIPMCVLVNGLICTLYTSIGGIRAVVWTDVLQMALMFGGILLVMVKGLYEVGGFSEAWSIAEEGGRINLLNFKPSLYEVNVYGIILGSVTNWLGTYAVTQTQVQRYCVVPTKSMARIALLTNIPGILLVSGMEYIGGMALFSYYSTCDPLKRGAITKADQIAPYFIIHKMRHMYGVPGLYVAAIFSGSLSTLSSGFHSLSAVTWNDLIKPYISVKDKQAVWITKGCSAVYGLLAIGAAFAAERIGTLIESYYYLIGSSRGPIVAVFLLGLCCPWGNAQGALTGYLLSLIICFSITGVSLYYPSRKSFLPSSIANCSTDSNDAAPWMNVTTLTKSYHEDTVPSDFVDALRINALFLPCLGFFLCIFIGNIVSILTGGSKGEKVNPKLFTPAVRRWIIPESKISNLHHSMPTYSIQGSYKPKLEHEFTIQNSVAKSYTNGGLHALPDFPDVQIKNRKSSCS